MGKKILFAVLALLVLLVGAGLIFFKTAVGPSNPATFLPADTILYAALPDFLQTASRWNQTSLAKISREPDVKKFLEKPLGKLLGSPKPGGPGPSGPGSASAGKVLLDLKPSRVFVSAQKLTEQEFHAVVGLQYWGGAASFRRAVGELATRLAEGQPVTILNEKHGDFAIEVFQLPHLQLAAAHWKNWGFIANDLAPLKAVLDSATNAETPKLAADPVFESTLKPLARKPDLLVFARVDPVLETVLTVGRKLGAAAIPQQVNAIREAQAVGFTTKLDGADLQDVLFIRTKKPLPLPPRLNAKDIEFTNQHSLGFFQFALDWDRLKPDENLAPNPGLPADALALLDQLHTQARDAFSDQAAVVVNWPDGTLRPQAALVMQSRDRAKATEFIEQTLTSFTGQASRSTDQDVPIYQFTPSQGGFLHPSLALVDSYVVAAPDLNDLQGILASRRNQTTLAKNPQFAAGVDLWKSANRGFGYIDAAQVFQRAYDALRPVMLFAAAVAPQTSEYLDLQALPESASIVRHLNPIVYSQSAHTEGILLESRGPITINQAAALAFGLGWHFGASALPGRQ